MPTDADAPYILIIMGVSGCGKTTIGAALAARLGCRYQEGDDFHPAANVEKMRAGMPLDDTDRKPWLEAIAHWMDAQSTLAVLACSALKRSYRDFLRRNRPQVWFVYLRVPHAILQRRVEMRDHQYMPASLLDSQLATLQEPAADEPRVLTIDAAEVSQTIVDAVLQALRERAIVMTHRQERPMSNIPKNTVCTIVPSLRYRDALGAIDWLCRAFGFEKNAVYTDDKGSVQHAQLSFGHGMIMLGSIDNQTAWGQRIVQPDEIDGRETQACYVIVADCAAHYARTKAAGAHIVDELETKDYGGSGYSCRDPEGHLWSFGDYDPWAEHDA